MTPYLSGVRLQKPFPQPRQSVALVFGLLLFCYSYVHQGIEHSTSASRLTALDAVVNRGTFALDSYGQRTADSAFFKGEYYSDKAPGVLFTSLPVFAVVAWVLRLNGVDVETEGWFGTSWLTTIGSIALLTAFGGAAYFAWLLRWVRPWAALIGAITLFLGVTVFPYSVMMFSHGMVSGLLAIALYCAVRPDPSQQISERSGQPQIIAGLACGLAVASEFTSVPPVLGIGVFLLWRNAGSFVRFAAGMLIPLGLIPLYSWLCFKNPFVIAYHYSTHPAIAHGFYGLEVPSTRVAVAYLFGTSQGLFFWCPALALVLVGLPTLRRTAPGVCWLVLGVAIAQIVAISGKRFDIQAGNTIGPRYLAPMVPFLMLPAVLGLQRIPRIGLCLVLYSVGVSTLATLFDATPTYGSLNPLFTGESWDLLPRPSVRNIGQLMGIPGVLSLLPFYCIAGVYLTMIWRSCIRSPDARIPLSLPLTTN